VGNTLERRIEQNILEIICKRHAKELLCRRNMVGQGHVRLLG
jgi:hypothetical protein